MFRLWVPTEVGGAAARVYNQHRGLLSFCGRFAMADLGLSNEEIENCRIAFNKFDKDGSGSISDWELRAMLQCMPRLNLVHDNGTLFFSLLSLHHCSAHH
jgi:hypothetical protein